LDEICTFVEGDTTYKSTEHYYQSKKVIYPKIQTKILEAKTAYDAWSLGNMFPLMKGWDDMLGKIFMSILQGEIEKQSFIFPY